jgi:hypothetical protein
MMNDTDQPAADTAESWAAQLGLPSAAVLTGPGQQIRAAAMLYRAATTAHLTDPPHPNLLIGRPLLEATQALVAVCPDLEDVVLAELSALQSYRPTVGQLAGDVDAAITTMLAGHHTGWRTVISVVPTTGYHDDIPPGAAWSRVVEGIHPAALAHGCPPAGPGPAPQ